MIQEFQLRALPEQAISEQALKQFIGREKRTGHTHHPFHPCLEKKY